MIDWHTLPQPGADDFAGQLRAWRESSGLTQAELAQALGVQWLAVQRWEAGERIPGTGRPKGGSTTERFAALRSRGANCLISQGKKIFVLAS